MGTTKTQSGFPLRWLAIPALMIVLAVVGLASSSESRSSFDNRLDRNDESSQPDPIDNPRPDNSENQTPSGSDGDEGQGFETPPGSDQSETADGGGEEQQGQGDPDQPVVITSSNGNVEALVSSDPPTLTEISFFEPDQTSNPEGVEHSAAPTPTAIAVYGKSYEILQGVGFQLSEDGELVSRSLELDSEGNVPVRPGDLVLAGVDHGVEILEPDGDRVFITIAPQGSVDIEIVAPDGNSQQLVANIDGEVQLEHGITIRLPYTFVERVWRQATETPWRWLAGAWLTIVVGSAILCYVMYRRRPEPAVLPVASTVDRLDISKASTFDLLLWLEAEPDPARATRLAFRAAEGGLGQIGARRTTETPIEWHERVAPEDNDTDQALAKLCEQFNLARFSDNTLTESDKAVVIASLRRLREVDDHPAKTTIPSR